MIGTILTDKDGNITNQVSDYRPPKPVADLTYKVKQDYQTGYNILHRSYEEFNDKTLIQRMNLDQKAFNSYVEVPSDNPDEEWRWNGVRPTTRNKVIAMAAHLVSQTLIPGIFAQNDLDEEDKDAANIMRYLVEWNIRNSNYEISYRQAVLGALVNPVAYLHADYAEVIQTIKEKMVGGQMTLREVVDEVLSGFQAHSIPGDEILINNAYQFYLQQQKCIFRRRFPDYDELKGRYGNHPNWKYVRPGIKVFCNDETGTFYEQYDDQLTTLGEECIYFNRREDIEVPYINGIYFGDANVDNNPMKHRDNKNHPKYPYAKTGFSLIDEGRFYYYKSLVFHMADDQELEDRVTRLLVDASVLETEPPMAGIGTGNVGTGVMYPGQLTPFKEGSSVTPLGIGRNLGNLYNLLGNIEQSIDESTISKTGEGQIYPEKRTKWEVQRAEMNAAIKRGIFGRMIGDLIRDFGDLMIDVIIHHETVGQVEETLSGQAVLKFRTFLLPNQTEGGKTITRKIRFKPEMIGRKITGTKEEIKKVRTRDSFRVIKDQGGKDADAKIYDVNPQAFRNLKFLMFVDYETLIPRGRDYEEAVAIRNYNLMRADPLFDPKEVAQDLAEALHKGDSDKYMTKEEIPPEAMMLGAKTRSAKEEVIPET